MTIRRSLIIAATLRANARSVANLSGLRLDLYQRKPVSSRAGGEGSRLYEGPRFLPSVGMTKGIGWNDKTPSHPEPEARDLGAGTTAILRCATDVRSARMQPLRQQRVRIEPVAATVFDAMGLQQRLQPPLLVGIECVGGATHVL